MTIKQLNNEEFKNFSQNFEPSSMFQTTYYAFTMNEQDGDALFVGLMDGNVLKAASLIIVQKINGFRYAFAPRGFLIDYNNLELVETFTKLLKKFLGRKDIVAIKINPLIIKNIYNNKGKIINQNVNYNNIFSNLQKLGYYHLGYNNYFEALKPRFEAVINIDLPYTKIFANIDKSFRTKIRKAERDGIKIFHGSKKNLEYLYLQTKNKYPRDLKYFEDLYDFFGQEKLIDFYYSKLDTTQYLKVTQMLYNKYEKLSKEINVKIIKSPVRNEKLLSKKIHIDNMFEQYKRQLVLATEYLKYNPDGIILSSALIIKWKDEIYLIMDGMDNKYKHFSGKHLLLWKLMIRYSKLGFKKFNLGGLSNITKPSKYNGLNEFKLNFNPKVIEYAGDFELITNKPLYFMYRNSKDISNMFKK